MTNFKATVANFLQSEDGAVTTDWVVLTAGFVGFGLVVMSILGGSAVSMSERTGDTLSSHQVITSFAPDDPSTTP